MSLQNTSGHPMEIIHLICVLNVTLYHKFCIFKPGILCWRQWQRIVCDRSMYLSLTANRILLHWILILPPLYKVMVLLWKRTQQRCFVMAKRITVLTPTIPCSEQSPQHEQVAHAQLPGLISLDMPASLQTSEEISVKRQPVAHAHSYTYTDRYGCGLNLAFYTFQSHSCLDDLLSHFSIKWLKV